MVAKTARPALAIRVRRFTTMAWTVENPKFPAGKFIFEAENCNKMMVHIARRCETSFAKMAVDWTGFFFLFISATTTQAVIVCVLNVIFTMLVY